MEGEKIMKRFVVGETYKTDSTNMYMGNTVITIINRTEKFVEVDCFGRKKIRLDEDGNEYIEVAMHPITISFSA